MQRRFEEEQESHHTRSKGLPERARAELFEVHGALESVDQHQSRTNAERQQRQKRKQVLLAMVGGRLGSLRNNLVEYSCKLGFCTLLKDLIE